MILSLIAALSENGVIGKDNGLPWHIPEDLAHFKRRTTGHPIIMGRKTFDSIGRPLPNRTNIVLTRQADWQAAGVHVARTLDDALSLCGDADEAFIIGGAALYAAALPRADKLYLTRIEDSIEGDTTFPAWSPAAWKCVDRQPLATDNVAAPVYIETYVRKD